MIAQIRELLQKQPFEPFYVHTSGGNRYRVATADHADISPSAGRMVIWFDNGGSVILSGLHIATVELEGAPSDPTL